MLIAVNVVQPPAHVGSQVVVLGLQVALDLGHRELALAGAAQLENFARRLIAKAHLLHAGLELGAQMVGICVVGQQAARHVGMFDVDLQADPAGEHLAALVTVKGGMYLGHVEGPDTLCLEGEAAE